MKLHLGNTIVPTNTPPRNKYSEHAGGQIDLGKLHHNDFEILVYRLYYNEIKIGTLRAGFDDILATRATRDKAIDAILYDGARTTGIIQCKHSIGGKPLTLEEFGKEMVKFCLYVLTDNSPVDVPESFQYWIVVSHDFAPDCHGFIKDFRVRIQTTDLKPWIEHAKKNYRSFEDIEVAKIIPDLVQLLSRVSVKSKKGVDILELLQKDHQLGVRETFFEIKKVIDNDALIPVHEKLDDIKSRLPDSPKSVDVDEIKRKFITASHDIRHYQSTLTAKSDTELKRAPLEDVFNWFESDQEGECKKVLAILGEAGVGKSVVIKQILLHAVEQGFVCLGLKADVLYAETLQDLSLAANLQPSLTDLIKEASRTGVRVLLIIDQIDALSQTYNANRRFINVYNLLIEEVTQEVNVRVVLSCRKFDIKYDPSLSRYRRCIQIEIKPLGQDEVKTQLRNHGVKVHEVPGSLLKVLTTIHHLSMFLEIHAEVENYSKLNSVIDLYDEIWRQKVKSVSEAEYLFNLAGKLYEQERLSIWFTPNDPMSDQSQRLLSSGILRKDKHNKIQFFHQGFYDYVFAVRFTQGQNDLQGFLGEQQGLDKRSGLRMILNYLRVYSPKEHLKALTFILDSNAVRIHLKTLVTNLMGETIDPSHDELKVAKAHLLTNPTLLHYFLDSAGGAVWLRFIFEQGFFNVLGWSEQEVDKAKNFEHLSSEFERLKLPKQIRASIDSLDAHNRLVGQLRSVLARTVAQDSNTVLDVLEKLPVNMDTVWVAELILHDVHDWSGPRPKNLFDRFEAALRDRHYYWDILEKAISDQAEWVGLYMKEAFSRIMNKGQDDLGITNHSYYSFTDFLEKFSSKQPALFFELGIETFLSVVGPKIHAHYGSIHWYDHRETNRDVIESLLYHLSMVPKGSNSSFADGIEKLKGSDSEAVNLLLVLVIYENLDSLFSEHFDSALKLFDQRLMFWPDNVIGHWLMASIEKGFDFLSATQKEELIDAIRATNDNRGSYLYEGKHHLREYGRIQYQYLLKVPRDYIESNDDLRREFLALERKHSIKTFRAYRPGVLSVGGVPAPITKDKIEKLTEEYWLESFTKYAERVNESNYLSIIQEHGRTFKEQVEKSPDKYVALVETLLARDDLRRHFFIFGLEGLEKGGFDNGKLHALYTKSLQYDHHEQDIYSLCWMSARFIGSKFDNAPIAAFLLDQLKSLNAGLSENTPEYPISRTRISSVAKSIDTLMRHSNVESLQDFVNETVELAKTSKEKAIRRALLNSSAFYMHIDISKAVDIFKELLVNADEDFAKASIEPLQYLIMHQPERLTDEIRRLMAFEEVQVSLTRILLKGANNDKAGCEQLLEEFLSRSVKAKVEVVSNSFKNRFDSTASTPFREFCEMMLYRFINSEEKEVIDEYDSSILRQVKEESFESWYPFLKDYIISSTGKSNPHYLLEIMKSVHGIFPEECLELVKHYKDFKPSNFSRGPYYSDEPVEIVIGLYNVFLNRGDDDLAHQTLDLFDEMICDPRFALRSKEIIDMID